MLRPNDMGLNKLTVLTTMISDATKLIE